MGIPCRYISRDQAGKIVPVAEWTNDGKGPAQFHPPFEKFIDRSCSNTFKSFIGRRLVNFCNMESDKPVTNS